MSNAPARAGGHAHRGALARARGLIARLWALALLLLVIWVTYLAGAYMVRYVFAPSEIPAGILRWQSTLSADALREANVRGISAPAPRPPLPRYHLVDRWFQPDPLNNCTVSGCHAPLAHGKHKDTRAFANLHSTFLACQMCHAKGEPGGSPAMWVSTTTGAPQEPPAILRLINEIEINRAKIDSDAAGQQPMILALLRETWDTVPNDAMIEHYILVLDTSEPGSPVWRTAVARLAEELPKRALGEYQAKIAPRVDQGRTQQNRDQMADLTRRYLSVAAASTEGKDLIRRVHADVLPKPAACVRCHGQEPPQLDLQVLGYPPGRQAALRGQPIARLIQQIREGRPFYLPGALESAGPTTTAPASP